MNPSPRLLRRLGLVAAFLFPLGAAVLRAAPPNVLIVLADQWRAQAFGYAGDPNARTPNIDRFERQAVNFTQAVSGQPVCTPMRATLLTGQRPLTHGLFLNDVALRPDSVSLAKELKAAGYDTACIGKWHIDGHGRSNYIPPERRQGFDYWKVLECTHAYNKSPYYAGDSTEKLYWDGYDAEAQTRDAQRYLSDPKRQEKPFLLWLAWGPPHNPYETAPARYRSQFSADKIQLRSNVPPSHSTLARAWLAGYYAHGLALDELFADLLRTLDERGLAENTIVLFTSDHGDMLGSHAQQRKQRPWEESTRVPLLWRVPGVAPRRTSATVNTEDLMPTLLSLCGRPIPRAVEGLDFAAHLRGGPDPSGGATVIRCPSPFGEYTRDNGGREFRQLRTARYSYVRDLNGPWLLFDHDRDPYELDNLVGKPEHAKLQAELEARLNQKLVEHRDEFRPGADYIAKWGYKVDARGTVPYTP